MERRTFRKEVTGLLPLQQPLQPTALPAMGLPEGQSILFSILLAAALILTMLAREAKE